MKLSKIFTFQFIVVVISVFVIAFGLSFLYLNNIAESSQDPLSQVESDTEIALIYFGCSTCPAANDERVPELLSHLAEKVKKKATSKGYKFTFIGTSNESNLSKGLDYLTGIATFDEIALGNGMENMVLQHYVWDKFDNPLSASTPQIIVSKRKYEKRVIDGRKVIFPNITSEEILIRKVGVKRMSLFVEREEAIF